MVAVEIDTGAIVTYISSPSFPINEIANGLSSDEFNKLLNDNNKPFFDRAGQGDIHQLQQLNQQLDYMELRMIL